jgi:FtsZ-binding cell division protein ZapB
VPNLVRYEGEVVDPAQDEIRILRQRIARLEEQLQDSRTETHHAKEQAKNAMRSIQNLQHQLIPWRNAILGIYGELEAIGISPSDTASSPRWESWKQKLPGKPAACIDALLEHGELTVKQLMAATKSGQNTIYQTMSKLGQLNLVASNGGRYSLREQ